MAGVVARGWLQEPHRLAKKIVEWLQQEIFCTAASS